VSRTPPLSYAGRCERYARQRGWRYDPQRMSIGHLTPAQRRRALRKERRAWRGYACGTSRDDARWNFYCDVCGLPDPYGTGDGIGSCDCPRCECGPAASSVLCTCPPDDWWDRDERDYEEEVP